MLVDDGANDDNNPISMQMSFPLHFLLLIMINCLICILMLTCLSTSCGDSNSTVGKPPALDHNTPNETIELAANATCKNHAMLPNLAFTCCYGLGSNNNEKTWLQIFHICKSPLTISRLPLWNSPNNNNNCGCCLRCRLRNIRHPFMAKIVEN